MRKLSILGVAVVVAADQRRRVAAATRFEGSLVLAVTTLTQSSD